MPASNGWRTRGRDTEIVQTLEREESIGRFFKDKADQVIAELNTAV